MNIKTEICEYLELIKERGPVYPDDVSYGLVVNAEELIGYSSANNVKLGIVYKSDYHIMIVDLLKDQNGNYRTQERLLNTNSGNAVVIVPRIDNKYILLRQFRYALGKYQYAFPRGFGEKGLSVEENAAKELEEEIGYRPASIRNIGTVVADSGVLSEEVNMLLCDVDGFLLKEGYEGIKECVVRDSHELLRMVEEEQINDGFTLSAISKLLALKEL